MPTAYHVLVVEDDQLIGKSLKMSLPYKGYQVTVCETFSQGLESFRHERFDLVLLDVNLPDGNGINLCQEMRKLNEAIPILMLTAKVDEASVVQGLEQGADDYIRKPYGVQELTARMARLLERKKINTTLLRFGGLIVDLQKRMIWAGEEELALGKREFEILALLVKKSGDVVTRNEILNALGEESEIYDRTIDSHLSHVRKKLREARTSEVQIFPVYGVGYRLDTLRSKK